MNGNEIQLLWPTPLLRTAFDQAGTVNPELARLFYEHRRRHGGSEGEDGGRATYSSSDDLLQRYDHPGLRQLFQFISNSVFDIASRVNRPIWQRAGASKLSMHVVGAWFQIQNRYGFHDIHSHGNCSWSGVYYVQIDPAERRRKHPVLGGDNGVTRFYSPRLDLLGGAHMDLGNAYLQDSSLDMEPEEGVLVVFPSYLNHKALPYDGDKDRIIISFNAQVHGEQGDQAFAYGF